MNQKIIKIYENEQGKSPFGEWFNSLDKKSKERILIRIDRLVQGNFGDCKFIDNNLYELRFHFSSGYRIYFAREGKTIVILLCGGDKSTQNKDIRKAKIYYKDYMENIK